MKILEEKIKSIPDLDLVSLLGGSAMVNVEIKSNFDLITLSNEGITKGSLEALIAHLGISRKDFAENILNISVKTLERKKSEDKLDRHISSHIIEIAKVVEHSFEVFENKEKVRQWLNTSNRALNNMKPIDLFYIPTGLAMVNTVLGRIEEGVYS